MWGKKSPQMPFTFVYSRGLKPCSWGPTVLQNLSPTLIEHTPEPANQALRDGLKGHAGLLKQVGNKICSTVGSQEQG